MTTAKVSFDDVFNLAQQLRPADRLRLMARLARTVVPLLDAVEASVTLPPRTPLRGLLADLGPAPSAEEIDAVQHEMWAPFLEEHP